VCLQLVDIYRLIAEGTLGDILDAEVIVQLKLRFLYRFTTKKAELFSLLADDFSFELLTNYRRVGWDFQHPWSRRWTQAALSYRIRSVWSGNQTWSTASPYSATCASSVLYSPP
jgi:hypothetical protein